MINEKMYELGSQRSEIRELFEYGKKRKAEIGEENVFDFSLGNPSVPCPDEVNEALVSLVKDGDSVSVHGYTSAQGDKAVRDTIASHIRMTHGFDVSGDDLYLTVGAAAALTCSLTATVCPGEEVILLAPYFPEYSVFVERTGAGVRIVKCKDGSFEPDAVEEAVHPAVAAAFHETSIDIIFHRLIK